MRPLLMICPVIALSACLNPQERCIEENVRELRELRALTSETRVNAARGYAIEEYQEIEVIRATCRGENADGTTFTFDCEETRVVDLTRRVAIDVDAEVRRLDQLEARVARLEQSAEQDAALCRSLHPE